MNSRASRIAAILILAVLVIVLVVVAESFISLVPSPGSDLQGHRVAEVSLGKDPLVANEAKPIRHGDVIRIGKATLEFEEEVELELGDDEPSGPAYWLVFHSGDRMGDRIPLSPGTNTVGRAPKGGANPVKIEEAGISGTHFEIRISDSGAIVKDLGSTNGTLVNGAKIIEAPIADGDTLQIAALKLRFLADAQAGDEEDDTALEGSGVAVLTGDEVPKRSLVATLLPLVLLAAIGGGGSVRVLRKPRSAVRVGVFGTSTIGTTWKLDADDVGVVMIKEES